MFRSQRIWCAGKQFDKLWKKKKKKKKKKKDKKT